MGVGATAPTGNLLGVALLRLSDVVDLMPSMRVVRFYDLAATEPTKKNRDPDWTAGALVAQAPTKRWYIFNVWRMRGVPGDVIRAIARRAQVDDDLFDRQVHIRIEMEGGSAGKFTRELFVQSFGDRSFDMRRPQGAKSTRAVPVSNAAQNSRVDIVEGPWDIKDGAGAQLGIAGFLDELDLFPDGDHDDMVDCVSGAFAYLKAPDSPMPEQVDRSEVVTIGAASGPALVYDVETVEGWTPFTV